MKVTIDVKVPHTLEYGDIGDGGLFNIDDTTYLKISKGMKYFDLDTETGTLTDPCDDDQDVLFLGYYDIKLIKKGE